MIKVHKDGQYLIVHESTEQGHAKLGWNVVERDLPDEAEAMPLDPHKLGTAALKAELAARQIEVPEGAKKADLVALLEAALAAEGGGHD
ncbi:HeH/LEM domain-containing protein [Neisseria shayeganii]|uniref:Acetate-CoA ligase n=1 Tax=Neisseria shayeganii 871 TaxID=1032488 RepID=G4CG93_9NEIS|nr:HeH/LEM domain-containing protein [Neisseria shayeganii]EGY53141.1 acetate-CoA ligase [Neisseria shayeganii 871]